MHQLIAEAREEEDVCRDGVLDFDGLYDLAWHLTRSQREAEGLLASTLGKRLPLDINIWRSQAAIRHLVRNYLRTSASSPIFPPLTGAVKKRRKAPSVTASSPEAGLDQLSPQEVACLILRERLGLPVGEIAWITGLERRQVNSALFSARERLAAFLPREAGT